MRNRKYNIKAFSFNIKDIVVFLKNYSNIIMLFTLFTCGLITGTVCAKNSEYCRYLLGVFTTDISNNQTFVNGILAVVLVLIANFIMGLCLVGSPFISIISVFEGIYIGCRYSYRLSLSGYDGIGRFFVTDIIFYIFLYIIFICSQYTAMRMSESLKGYYCYSKGAVSLRNYLLKFAAFLAGGLVIVIFKAVIISVL